MMPVALLLTVTAIIALLVAGYLFGAKAGRAARGQLVTQNGDLNTSVVDLSAQLRSYQTLVTDLQTQLATGPKQDVSGVLRQQLEGMLRPLLESQRNDPAVETLRQDFQRMMATVTNVDGHNVAFRDELRKQLATLSKQTATPEQLQTLVQNALRKQQPQPERDHKSDIKAAVSEALAPMLDQERMAKALAQITVGGGGLRELPSLLDTIAATGGFATVVLSDESGLPLAANQGALDVDGLCGVAAAIMTLADRTVAAQLPQPIACVVLDNSNQVTLHRIFGVRDSRFTLSAVARGQQLAPNALDGALAGIERALGRPN